MSDVEQHQAEVDQIEKMMLAAPELILQLRGEREAALERLLQAEVLEDEQYHQEVMRGVHEAMRALNNQVPSDWTQRHRRWHSTAVKARSSGMMGAKAYAKMFPW